MREIRAPRRLRRIPLHALGAVPLPAPVWVVVRVGCVVIGLSHTEGCTKAKDHRHNNAKAHDVLPLNVDPRHGLQRMRLCALENHARPSQSEMPQMSPRSRECFPANARAFSGPVETGFPSGNPVSPRPKAIRLRVQLIGARARDDNPAGSGARGPPDGLTALAILQRVLPYIPG